MKVSLIGQTDQIIERDRVDIEVAGRSLDFEARQKHRYFGRTDLTPGMSTSIHCVGQRPSDLLNIPGENCRFQAKSLIENTFREVRKIGTGKRASLESNAIL